MCICYNCDSVIDTSTPVAECVVCKTSMHEECACKCFECSSHMCFSCSIKNNYNCGKCVTAKTYDFDYMSASRFDSYMTCPYMFYNQYILNTISKEDSNNKYNVIGNLLHKIFDKWSQIRPLNEELIALEYTNAFDSIDRKLFDDDYEFNTLKTLHTTTLSNWIRHEETMQVPRTSEQEIEFNIDGIDVPIKAILDRIEDNYDLLDYKTGKVYSSDKLENNLQMAIYALAIKHKYGVLPKKITLYFPQFDAERVFENIIGDTYVCNVKRGGTYSFTLTDRINTMQSIYTKMKKGIYPLSTQNSYFCSKFCAVGLTKQCDAVNL